MDPTTRADYDASRNFAGKPFKAGCYAPYTSMLFLPSGDAYVCCRNGVQVLGNVSENGVREMWEGPVMQGLRRALKNYEFGGGCEFCGWAIENRDYQGSMTRSFEHHPVSSETPQWPSLLEFAMSNVCNFACTQCGGMYSSRIRAQREGLPPLAKQYGEGFFAEIETFLGHTKALKFTGGEPFLAEENYRIWDMMHKMGFQPEYLSVLTNGSQWNARIEEVLHRFRFHVGVSIDAYSREVLERIRVGAVHSDVIANIRRLSAYTKSVGTDLFLSFSWMQDNWMELPQMLLFAEEVGASIEVIRVVHPSHCSLFALPVAELREVSRALEAEAPRVRPQLRRNAKAWDNALSSLRRELARGDGGDVNYSQVSAIYHETPGAKFQNHLDKGCLDEAIKVADALADGHPEAPRLRVKAASIARQAGKTDEAARRLDALQELCRRYSLYWSEVAWQRFVEGQAKAGLEAVATGRRCPMGPGNEVALAHVECVLLAELGRGDDLAVAGVGLIKAEPGIETELEIARLLARCGHADAAVHYQSVGGQLLAGPERAEVFLALAELAWGKEDLVAARAQVGAALSDQPALVRALWSLACIEEKEGDLAAARQAIDRAEECLAADDPTWLVESVAELRGRLNDGP